MTTLYPFLSEALQAKMLSDLETDWRKGAPPSTLSEDGRYAGREFPSSGGTPVRDSELRELRDEIWSALATDETSEDARALQRGADRAVGRILLRRLGTEPSALFRNGTWAFLTMVLLPDMVLTRYGSPKKFPRERFQDGRRNALATLYLRELMLPTSDNSTHDSDDDLLAEELLQLFDRTLTADRRLLKAMVARRQNEPPGVDRRTFFRELLREATFERTVTMLAVLDDSEMEELADQLVERTGERISTG